MRSFLAVHAEDFSDAVDGDVEPFGAFPEGPLHVLGVDELLELRLHALRVHDRPAGNLLQRQRPLGARCADVVEQA